MLGSISCTRAVGAMRRGHQTTSQRPTGGQALFFEPVPAVRKGQQTNDPPTQRLTVARAWALGSNGGMNPSSAMS